MQTYRIILESLFEKQILIDVLENASLKTFETKAMQYIVTYLWQQLLPYYFIQAMLYLLAVFCFTFGHFCELFEPTTIWYQMYSYFLLVSGILVTIFVIFECRHVLRRGLQKHFKSGWNCYEVLTYATSLASVALKLIYPLPQQEILDATALILLWIGIFNKIRGFENFSVLITTFTQILSDIRYFMIMLGVLICAFAMAFKLLVRGEDIFDNVVAIESTYNLMFGMTDLDVFVEEVERTAFEFYEAIAVPGAVAPEMPEFLYNEEIEIDLEEVMEMEEETEEMDLETIAEEASQLKKDRLLEDIEEGNLEEATESAGGYSISKDITEDDLDNEESDVLNETSEFPESVFETESQPPEQPLPMDRDGLDHAENPPEKKISFI